MKKIIYLFFITILVLIGCTNNTNVGETQSTKEAKQTSRLEITTENTTTIEVTTEEPTTTIPEPTEAALAIREVLKNERPFLDADNGYKETYRNDYSYFQGNNNANIGWWTFTMFDIGNDGVREVWITVRNLKYYGNRVDINDTARMIFRFYNGQVYGYQCNKTIELGDDEYFEWNSDNLYWPDDIKYKGGGKIEFEGEKIKYIYYTRKEDVGAKEWLKNLMPDENIEIVEDNEMCDFIAERCEERSKYKAGDIESEEEIDKYVY